MKIFQLDLSLLDTISHIRNTFICVQRAKVSLSLSLFPLLHTHRKLNLAVHVCVYMHAVPIINIVAKHAPAIARATAHLNDRERERMALL